jgi:hypothetical protein
MHRRTHTTPPSCLPDACSANVELKEEVCRDNHNRFIDRHGRAAVERLRRRQLSRC